MFLFPSIENPAFLFYAAYPSLSPCDQKESPEVSLHLPPSQIQIFRLAYLLIFSLFFPRLLFPYFFS